MHIEAGTVGSLDVAVPWAQLASGKVQVAVTDVNITCKISELDLRDEGKFHFSYTHLSPLEF